MSLDCSFPHVNPVLQLAITKHEFCPGHLYKLDAIVKEKPTAKTFEISDDGAFTQHERDASPKDYPSFHTLFDPLVIYFEILQFFIISSGNVAAIHQVNLGCSEYLRILYQIYSRYEWSTVLQYFYCNMFVFLFDVKILNIFCICRERRGMYACVCGRGTCVRPCGA